MFGTTVDISVFRNPTIVQAAPGDTDWHKLTGYPPDETNITGFLVETVANDDGPGAGCWLQWNATGAPSDTSKAWKLHGAGQVLAMGGGQQNLYYKLSTASDTLVLMYEG